MSAALAGQGVLTDPDTGLVYQGNGRYYDPALGRPRQPNPFGGVPTVPQQPQSLCGHVAGAAGGETHTLPPGTETIPNYLIGNHL